MAKLVEDSSRVQYTEEDAEADVEIFMKEAFDVNTYTILESTGTVKDDRTGSLQRDDSVQSLVQKHLRNSRFLQFADDFVLSEMSFLEQESWELVDDVVPKEADDLQPDLNSPSKSRWPLKLPVNTPGNPQKVTTMSNSTEADVKQLRKDIERDQLLVNSKHVIGASSMLDGVLNTIKEVCNHILQESGLPAMPQVTNDHLAHAILFKASRTNSGGIVFGTLQSLIDQDSLLLIPQSSMSPPLKVTVHLGSFPKAVLEDDICHVGAPPWGLICKIECESFYLVRRSDDLMNDSRISTSGESVESDTKNGGEISDVKGAEFANKLLSAVYEDFVLFEIKSYGNEMANVSRILTDGGNGAHVLIKPIAAKSSSSSERR